jgi:hypothetical protein
MRVLARLVGVAAMSTSLAGTAGMLAPAHAQSDAPHINLLSDTPTKTQEERDAEEARQKAYKESLRKIPDAKGASDPWGGVRSGESSSGAAKPPAAKTSASTKPKTKTGGNAN